MDTVSHRWLMHQGTELHWCDMDSQSLWQANMKKPEAYKILQSSGWDQPDIITYKFNSHGFRCDEFSQEPGIITLGCSFTGGVALPLDCIWPTLVAQQLNLKLWNLGVGSASMDSCFRLLNHYISKLNVCMVLLLIPPRGRFEMFMPDGSIEWVIPHTKTLNNYQKVWYQNDQNSIQNYTKNRLAIRQLCFANNIKLIEKDSQTDLIELTVNNLDLARDLQHPGVSRQQQCANLFLNAV